jgi:hypothetical protein
VDCAKTLITASGIAVALLASSNGAFARTGNSLATWNAKIAVICLISCIVASLGVILALVRGHELSNAGMTKRQSGTEIEGNLKGTQGKLTNKELRLILLPTVVALIGFLCGLAFAGRIAWHF